MWFASTTSRIADATVSDAYSDMRGPPPFVDDARA
jgi:hypothetical protein